MLLNASSFALKEVAGAAVGLDINLMLVQRDKFISHLYPYLAYKASHIRLADFQSAWLMPTVHKVVEDSLNDAVRDQTRQITSQQVSVVQRSSKSRGGRCKSCSKIKPFSKPRQQQ